MVWSDIFFYINASSQEVCIGLPKYTLSDFLLSEPYAKLRQNFNHFYYYYKKSFELPSIVRAPKFIIKLYLFFFQLAPSCGGKAWKKSRYSKLIGWNWNRNIKQIVLVIESENPTWKFAIAIPNVINYKGGLYRYLGHTHDFYQLR